MSSAPIRPWPRKAERLIRELIRIQKKDPTNWPTLSIRREPDDTDLEVMGQYAHERDPRSLEIAFVLNEKGQFLGITNWKE